MGRRYRNVPGRDFGSHFSPSTLTSLVISFSSSVGSKAGRQMRRAELSMRLQLSVGRNRRSFES